MADTHNAHVRGAGRRNDPDVAAAQAASLLDNPAFTEGVLRYQRHLVTAIEDLEHDGSPAADEYERELCRELRTLKGVIRQLRSAVSGQQLRAVNFRTKE